MQNVELEPRASAEVFPPQLHQFKSLSEWLCNWVEFQISGPNSQHRKNLPSGPGLYLFGSIGLDTAIACNGEFWIALWDFSDDTSEKWRLASETERTSIIISAQRKRFPELIALLPTRPQNAVDCNECNGTGHIYNNVVWCSTCGCLGWLTQNYT